MIDMQGSMTRSWLENFRYHSQDARSESQFYQKRLEKQKLILFCYRMFFDMTFVRLLYKTLKVMNSNKFLNFCYSGPF